MRPSGMSANTTKWLQSPASQCAEQDDMNQTDISFGPADEFNCEVSGWFTEFENEKAAAKIGK